MSEENVEVVRGHIEAWHAQDAQRALSFCEPHVVWDTSRTGTLESAGVAYGHEALAESWRRYAGAFEDYRWEGLRVTDLGSGAVLAVMKETGRGKGSGVLVDRSLVVLYTVIGGRIARMTSFPSEQEALEAVGLEE